MPHILQLMTMARFVDSVMRKSEEADDLLPEILSYQFWGVPRVGVWELSLRARREHKRWLMAMRESGGKLKEIADFLIELGAKATSATAEEVLHELIGGPQLLLPDDEDGDDEESVPAHEMFSPFRLFYFGREKFDGNRAEYLRFLSALRSFVRALREYHPGRSVSTADMIAFVDAHVANNLAINNVDLFANDRNAVQLMVAHKAKGLQFEAVIVLNCEEEVWASWPRGKHSFALKSIDQSGGRRPRRQTPVLLCRPLARKKTSLSRIRIRVGSGREDRKPELSCPRRRCACFF